MGQAAAARIPRIDRPQGLHASVSQDQETPRALPRHKEQESARPPKENREVDVQLH